MRLRRARGERGAALVEFAFVAPALFLMMFGLVDFALAELSDAAGANAAREGARVGVLYYDGAHTSGSANHTKIVDAVRSKLAGTVVGTPTVVVRCLNADGTPRSGGGSCSTVSGDAIEPGSDLIEVTVTWTRKGGITGFIGSPTRTDKAVTRIVGTPPAGAPSPPTCTLSAGSASPNPVVRDGAGDLPAITFSVTVSDPALCGAPLLDLPAQSAYGAAQPMSSPGGNVYSFTMPAGQGTWTAGTKTAVATANGGSVSHTISFTVNDPSVCLITSGTASPSSVSQTGGTLSSAVLFTVVVSDVAVCGTPTLTFPPQAAYPGPRTMAAAGGNSFTWTLPVGQGSWTSQTYTMVANANGGATATIPVVVSDAPVCTLSNLTVSPSTASVKKNGQEDIETTVTIRVTRNNLAPVCAVPTVQVPPGNSGEGSSDLTTPRQMRNVSTTAVCTNVTCEWVIPAGADNWYPASGARTVAVTASGSTLTATLNLT
jgi:Flp pilus assembly protein TadG